MYTPNGIFTMNPTLGRWMRFAVRAVERTLANRSAAVIAVSPEEQQHMLQIGFPVDRVHVIPNGLRQVDWPDRRQVRQAFGYSDEHVVIGFLGRLATQKNPLLMIEAFSRLRGGASRLALVGTGPLESAVRRLAVRRGVFDRIDWLGYKTAAQIMPAFDIFVMPSQYEGMPYVLMEAVSLGIPTVATRVGGASLSVDHRRNGLLVAPGEAEELAQAIQGLVDNSQMRADFSAAAREKSRQFAVERMVLGTLELYWKVARRNSAFV